MNTAANTHLIRVTQLKAAYALAYNDPEIAGATRGAVLRSLLEEIDYEKQQAIRALQPLTAAMARIA